MQRKAWRVRRFVLRPVSGNFVIGFLYKPRLAAKINAHFICGKLRRNQPRAGFESNDIQPRSRQRQDRHTADRAEPDHHHIGFFQG